jgi:hypothetical protein
MRTLTQPGPAHPQRIDCSRGELRRFDYRLQAGVTLNHALTQPLIDAGFQSATVTFRAAPLNPFQYVMPGPPDSASHVAYFSAPRSPVGTSRIEQANASFGQPAESRSSTAMQSGANLTAAVAGATSCRMKRTFWNLRMPPPGASTTSGWRRCLTQKRTSHCSSRGGHPIPIRRPSWRG